MEAISVFDIFKIGVGPSSSHTLGPWRAARQFLAKHPDIQAIEHVEVHLFGSLAKTGKGHGTDIAVQLGLMDFDPEYFDVDSLGTVISDVEISRQLIVRDEHQFTFDPTTDIVFHMSESLPFHPNAVTFKSNLFEETYYSVGGGFVVTENEELSDKRTVTLPHHTNCAEDIKRECAANKLSIAEMVFRNELAWRTEDQINARLDQIWHTMLECLYRGCHTEGILPGGLNVVRRAAKKNREQIGDVPYKSQEQWCEAIQHLFVDFDDVVNWISTFALAVNEENAAFGRVVTAPTNGAAGVIPAVMLYAYLFKKASQEQLREFMLVAGEIGSLFKKGATISAAMGGCMAEIGVSSAMAAAGLTHILGGSTDQVLMAAEISMEHHLGMTCDPILGLVQVPCIERNTMGAMKAITAANMAITSDPSKAKVSLDDVIKTMWDTAKDMNSKYKETSEGGLATNISVLVPEC
ncbi:MAG: L-serine ammonia-lyase [Armatimonadetes bacterium]|nr:L-serine ammonia-lyase [Armatimonadota bacterium]